MFQIYQAWPFSHPQTRQNSSRMPCWFEWASFLSVQIREDNVHDICLLPCVSSLLCSAGTSSPSADISFCAKAPGHSTSMTFPVTLFTPTIPHFRVNSQFINPTNIYWVSSGCPIQLQALSTDLWVQTNQIPASAELTFWWEKTHFMYLNSFHLHNNLMNWVIILFSFSRWQKWKHKRN